ncbi:hypothetical protein PR048_004987 [Dryococelus australis]|uniref:Reverse transcriptase domain-containing protein n=1 Tax=Dryococelus australis TaxID=614101 RepID=A0ABQ9I6Y9_9NEOP|nr:hypothetical protein PR048_004987 [Dryococelus australis]
MPFGLASAADVFQQIMRHTLHEIMDDILLHTESINELYAITETVVKKLAEAGLTLNHSKCVLGQTQIKFLGHVLSDKGIQPDQENIKAIERLKKTSSIPELEMFLEMINYLSKFIPKVAEHSAPLRKLLEKDTIWHWELEQENVFEDLKESLKSLPLLRYFDHTKPVTISVDASSHSVASVLLQ